MSQLNTRVTNVEFDTPANRIISQFQPKNKFRIDTSLPDIAFLRQLSVQGRIRYFIQSGTGDIDIIPNDGETFFFGHASVSNSSVTVLGFLTISNDGNTRETLVVDIASKGTSVGHTGLMAGSDSLVGNGIRIFKMAVSGAGAIGNLWGWIENTSRIRDVTN